MLHGIREQIYRKETDAAITATPLSYVQLEELQPPKHLHNTERRTARTLPMQRLRRLLLRDKEYSLWARTASSGGWNALPISKETLLLYASGLQFLEQQIESDELHTKVHHNKPSAESEGWTIVLTNRATRFIWELRCGERERELFEAAIQLLSQVTEQTEDLTLLTDGERRYGNLLFEICQEVLRTGKPGRPKKSLPKGVKVRIKSKGSQEQKRGRKRPKYQAPRNEHPDTRQTVADSDIHANHAEGFNSSPRRIEAHAGDIVAVPSLLFLRYIHA